MTKIWETYIVSSKFDSHFVLEMPNKTGVSAPRGCHICVGNNDTSFANATFDNRCIRDIPAELQIYAENIYHDINRKIDQIIDMLPREKDILPKAGNKKRSLFDGLGNILAYVTGIATEGDLNILEQRLRTLESFVSDNQEASRTELGHLLVAERLLARRMDVLLENVKTHAYSVDTRLQSLIARTSGMERQMNYVRTYIVKFMRWMQGSIKIINFLDQLIQALTWADRDVLSPLIIPTRSLRDMLEFVTAHLENKTALRIIPASVSEIHEMVSFYMLYIKGTLLVVLNIPLTSFPGPLDVYEIHSHPIRVLNSALDSVLELEYSHVAIHKETGVFTWS